MLVLLALACSNDCQPDQPCGFQGGDYYVLEADEPTDRALIYLHGAGTDAEGLPNRHKEEVFLAGGYHMVYPNAPNGFWQVSRGQDAAAEDAAWVASLADQLELDGVATDFYVGGQSVGGSMTWYVACNEADRFVAFAPSSGGFWVPEPTDCDVGPVKLRHSHGTLDTMVPMEGRELNGEAAQGNIYEGLDMWREHDGCSSEVVVTEEGPYTCSADVCDEGGVQLCLYEGKHGTPDNWEPYVVDWLNAQ